MDPIPPLRLHVLGYPLVDAFVELVTSTGENLASVLDGNQATLAFDRAGDVLAVNFWPELGIGAGGLFSPDVSGQWVGPSASLSIREAAPDLLALLSRGFAQSDVLEFSARDAQVLSLSLKDTRFSEPEQSLYLAASSVRLEFRFTAEGLELLLEAPVEASSRVHKGALNLDARLRARFFLPANAFGYVGLSAKVRYDSAVAVANWTPTQTDVADLAANLRSVVARGTLDWGGKPPHRSPTGPWVRCLLDAHRMHLVPCAGISLRESGAFGYSRTEGELEFRFGSAVLEKALENRTDVQFEMTGPVIGHVDGVTTWPMEQGGPRPQEFERLAVQLSRNDEGVRFRAEGVVGPGGDLGPDVTMDFLIPALWLRIRGWR